MTQQTKTKLFAGAAILLTLVQMNSTCAAAPLTMISDVAEQKSVIDEPAIPLIGSFFVIKDEVQEREVETVEETEVKIRTEVPYSIGWTNSSVNIRKQPNLESEIITTVPYNTEVYYHIEKDSEWSEVNYLGMTSYIKTEYISTEINPSLSPYIELIDNLTEYEKYLIYQITFAEAGNQTMEGQRAVIEVIFNRVLSDKFPNTVEGVLSQKGQFSTWKMRDSVEHNAQQVEALQLVYTEAPQLESNYLIFSTKQQSYGKNYIKIDDQWFGMFK